MSFIFERPDLAQVQDAPRTRSSPRRTHTKSRLGCIACKRRRIKCDEVTPACGQCRDKGVDCIYSQRPPNAAGASRVDASDVSHANSGATEQQSSAAAPQQATTGSKPPPEQPPPEPFSNEEAKTRVLAYLAQVKIPRNSPSDTYHSQHAAQILDHFTDGHPPSWAGSPECQRVLQTWALTLAVTNPFLLHGVLAFSASHLHAIHPNDEKYRIAASLHYGLSLTGFAASLGNSVSGDNADALFACCYLHAMLAFHYKRRNDEPDSKDSDFAWLRLMKGIPILQRTNVLRPHLTKSLWLPVFIESGAFSPQTGPLPEPPQPNKAAHHEIEILRGECGVTAASTEDDGNPYATPLVHLDKLSRMTVDSSKIGSLMVFIGRMPEEFVQLLEKLDVRALKVLRFWCRFAQGVEQWWCRGPAVDETVRLSRVLAEKESLLTPESMN